MYRSGGLAGQVLCKKTDNDNDVEWKSINVKDDIKDLKMELIKYNQNFIFYNNGSGLVYNLNGIIKSNLSRIEIGYTTKEYDKPTSYKIVSAYNGTLETNITQDTTIYIWIKLTYSDIGEIVINSDKDDSRYYVYIVMGGVACFTSDTLIMTEDGLKEISKLNINDKIITTNGAQKITKTYRHFTSRIYQIYVNNDVVIKASWSHPFITANRGVVLAKDLAKDDLLYDINGKHISVKNIKLEDHVNVEVYEINTEKTNNYYISDLNILVESENLI